MAKSTSWNNTRLPRQRVAAQTWPAVPSLTEVWDSFVGTRAEVRQRGGVIPAWVPLTAIAFALALLCLSATIRARAAFNQARAHCASEAANINAMRAGNAALLADIERLKHDPSAIADAAHQYGLIRANEKVVMFR